MSQTHDWIVVRETGRQVDGRWFDLNHVSKELEALQLAPTPDLEVSPDGDIAQVYIPRVLFTQCNDVWSAVMIEPTR